ncbi:MAG: FHA domain-containing protein [Xanthomonadales bacterium]|nr:FHA domain-containing protein [Xanthomonadales bacterium]
MQMAKYRIKGTSGATANEVYELVDRLLIGRADDCNVRIANDAVSPRHCELLVSEQGDVLLTDLESGSGTRVNGVAVQKASLNSGDEISVANCRFLLQAPGLRPQRVLTEEAVRKTRSHLPWLLPTAVILAVALAWQRGWLSPIIG